MTLISGPVTVADPAHVKTIHVESARDMLAAVEKALPADVAIFAAAVADWRVDNAHKQKIKKSPGARTPALSLTENPDILATVAHRNKQRPETRDRLCRRNAERRGQRESQAGVARAATGLSPTTCHRTPASWAATATR